MRNLIPRGQFVRLAAILAPFLGLGGMLANASDDPALVAFFETKIRPVLVEHCQKCHGSELPTPKGGLQLDSRNGLRKGGDSGPVVVVGKPEESPLYQAIAHSGEVSAMPPKTKLTPSVVADFHRWIAQGAVDPRTEPASPAKGGTPSTDWWSLRPLKRPEVPSLGEVGTQWSRTAIDRFIYLKLTDAKLQPAPESDRRTLIRRVSYDLTGLPPSPQEVNAFVRDPDPNAYELLIDRLLASSRYGERWARHWLDLIHFADTHGFEHDVLRPNAWRYRDYVIESFNVDKPWPRFIQEQLAADVLCKNEPRLKSALGFLGAGPYDQSAAATAPMAFEYLDRDDLVTQTMGAFVSTTANCARCHAHKFDPISQEDYFSLQAVFAGIGKGDISYDEDQGVEQQRSHWKSVLAACDQEQTDLLFSPENRSLVAAWEQSRSAMNAWIPLDVDVFVSSGGADLKREPDGSILSGGTRPDKETTTLTVTSRLSEIHGLRLDVLADPSLPLSGPGRMDNGNLHLSEFEAMVFRPGQPKPEKLKFRRATADWNQVDWGIARAIDGNPATAWGIYPKVGESHHAVFEFEQPLKLSSDARLVVVLKQLHGGGHILGRLRLSATSSPGETSIALPALADSALQIPIDQRSAEQNKALASAVLKVHAEVEIAKLPAQVKVYGAASMAENDRGLIAFASPRIVTILNRGELDKPGEQVVAGSLSAVTALKARFELSDPSNEAARRVALADWIADPNNPLTWRSIANRVWQSHFGRGLCDTPNDFGRMGGLPSHPELLDWLAAELRDQGGSLKHLHRLICRSSVYRQASIHREEAAAIDPENRLLWRMNRQRLDADAFRDTVLAVSGRLDLTMGGVGIALFQSRPGPQLTPTLDYSAFDWDSPGAGRRSIYRVVWRSIPDPLMEALDFPDASLLAPIRGFSVSPLQTLALLNNNFVLNQSGHLASRVKASQATTADQIREAFRLTLLRDPTPEESSRFVAIADKHSLAAACRLLLNCNEFLFVE